MRREEIKKQIKNILREIFDMPQTEPEFVSQDPFDSLDRIELYVSKVSLRMMEPKLALEKISNELLKGIAHMSMADKISSEDKSVVDLVLIPIQEEIDLVLNEEQTLEEFFSRTQQKIDEFYGDD